MKKCKLCGKELRESYRGSICRECRGKVGNFAKKSATGVIAAAGAVAAGVVLKAKGVTADEIAEAGKKIPIVEGLKTVKKAGENVIDKASGFIDDHSLSAKELLDKSIDAAEYRMKGLPASFAKADKIGLASKVKNVKNRMKYIEDFDDEYEEPSDQLADIGRR